MLYKKIICFLSISCLLNLSCAQKIDITNINSPGKNIICFGNSLTSGEGASSGNDYPSIIARQIQFPVINAGKSSDTTEDALKRITQDVLSQSPRLVIIEFGGNDFLQGMSKEQSFSNLNEIVKRIQDAKAMAVLVEVRTSLIGDTYLAGFQKIARKHKALLIPDILHGITTNPKMRSDYIHPNDEGYKLMAARILTKIKPLLDQNSRD